jgi:uncharacterized protein YqgC (DUF456 family)
MNALYFAIALIIMAVGLAGTVLPVIPGIILIYLGYFLYGLLTSWRDYAAGTMILWGSATAGMLFAEHYGAFLGAKRSGSSIFGIWGSFAGAVLGMMLFGLAGLIAGTFAGAVVGELVAGHPPVRALKSGKGALTGFLAGSLLKVVVGLIMIGTFIWQVGVRR